MQEESGRKSNAARTEETRARLMAAARALFVEKGYAETSTPEVVKAAGVTRGALYHHFTDKADLFRAVLRREFQAVAGEIDAATKDLASDPIQSLIQGGRAYLAAMRAPGRVRLMLLDGPAVLGRQELDAIDRETSQDTLKKGLEAAIGAGFLRSLPLDALVGQLSALFDRAALGISLGEPEADHVAVFEGILEGVRA